MDAWCAADRAVDREIGRLSVEWRRRVWGLRTIATVAPWVGVFGSCVMIVESFKGIIGERESLMFIILCGLGEALVLSAAGLATGIVTVWVEAWLECHADRLRCEASRGWAELRLLTR